MEHFDLLVIGGGPGGYLCAQRAAQGGMTVCLFEARHMGGTCLNEGCIPTKTLLNSVKLYRHAAESAAFGVTAENVVLDHAAVLKRKGQVVKQLVTGVESAMKSHKITVIREKAAVAGRAGGGFQVDAGGESFTGTRLAIASGAEAVVPSIAGLKEALKSGFAFTSREALDLKELPKEMAVIGGGVVGLELAYFFAMAGVKVTVIEMRPRLAGDADPEICKVLMDDYKKRNMTFKLDCRVLEVTGDSVVWEEKGERQELKCGAVLVSTGRHPNTAGLGLEKLGIETDGPAVVTDRHLCTNVAGVYAIGDCNGRSLLAHTASR